MGRPFLLQDLLPAALLDLFTLWKRTGLMRNPKAGLFQGKGKNSTCHVSLGRRESGPSTGEHKGAPPHFGERPLAPLDYQQSTPKAS